MDEDERKALGEQLMQDLEKEEKQDLKKAQDSALKKEIEEKDWSFLQFIWVIVILLPTGFWLWPKIPDKWLPTANVIMVSAGFFVAAAAFFKLRQIITSIKEMVTDDPTTNVSIKPLSSERKDIQLKVDFECKDYYCKPLTKSLSTQHNYKKNEQIHYRHEGKIKGEDDLLGPNVTKWGGSEPLEGGSGSGRGIQKKAPKR